MIAGKCDGCGGSFFRVACRMKQQNCWGRLLVALKLFLYNISLALRYIALFLDFFCSGA